MTSAPLRGDCARCAALCCVALAFDRSPAFAFSKANGEPCRHLDAGCRCRIHDARARLGFSGCVGYDCLGAGQRVTQEVFGGRSWRDDPALLEPMCRAFLALCDAQALHVLLDAAATLDLTPRERRDLDALRGELDPAQGWTEAALAAFRAGPTPARVRAFLATLKDRVAARG